VGAGWPAGALAGSALDPAEQVALVARARRELLLRAHRHRLRWEDLEDCYSQATLELVAHARGGARFASRAHLANVIEQRFLSRIHDRRRALSGRSPMQAALETALSLDVVENVQIAIVDVRADPERLTIARQDLRRVQALARQLTPDQRLVLACQVGLQMGRAEFCQRHGWSAEKYRKVAQRARARLRALMAEDVDPLVPPAPLLSEVQTGTAHEHFSPHS
jgi:DNA-directed RNA polymerase specialized sigma24 family protein